jgi:hypothetical protein
VSRAREDHDRDHNIFFWFCFVEPGVGAVVEFVGS